MDGQSYELCSDMIDVVIDVSCIYGCVSVSVTAGHLDPHRLLCIVDCVSCFVHAQARDATLHAVATLHLTSTVYRVSCMHGWGATTQHERCMQSCS